MSREKKGRGEEEEKSDILNQMLKKFASQIKVLNKNSQQSQEKTLNKMKYKQNLKY